MKTYYRVVLGRQSAFAVKCYAEGFIGPDFAVPHVSLYHYEIRFKLVKA
jgi:hypothetical protein